jgi:hypothetical protein
MNKIDKIQLRVIEELEDDFIISITRDDKEVELTYKLLLGFIRVIEKQGSQLAFKKYEHTKKDIS